MPFYQQSWNETIGDVNNKVSLTKKLRTFPLVSGSTEEASPQELEKSTIEQYPQFDKEKVIKLRDMLKQHVHAIEVTRAAEPIKDSPHYLEYSVYKDQIIFAGQYSNIYGCTNGLYDNMIMVVREFFPSSLVNPDNDFYLKLIRYIGKYFCINFVILKYYTDIMSHNNVIFLLTMTMMMIIICSNNNYNNRH